MKNVFTFLLISLFCIYLSDSFAQTSEFYNPPSDIPQYNVIPPEYSTIGGTATFIGPLASTARTIQFLIHDSLLTDFVGLELQGLSFRLPVTATTNWPAAEVTYPSYDVYLSGSVDPSARSLTFANNIVGIQTQVRSGPLVIPAESYTFNQIPNDWGPQITFDSSWLYNSGNLLIELRTSIPNVTSRSIDAISTSTPGYGVAFSACWASGSTATTGSQGNFCVLRLTADLPIPVELTSFTATAFNNNVNLNWITASELNNSGFEIQRKSNGSEFQNIGFVNGNGTTTEVSTYTFTDINLNNGNYTYRLKQIDFDGSYDFSNEINIDVNSVEVFKLDQNFPNPFNPSTTIRWQSPVSGHQTLKVYDVLGNEVATLVDEYKPAGIYNVQFTINNLSSGVFFYQLRSGDFVQTNKMILMK